MKRILLLICLLLYTKQFQAQTINIPDRNFKIALINTLSADLNGDGNYDSDVDTNNDNEIQVSEAEAVKGLDVGLFLISSLEGIQYFKNIEVLYSDYNKLTTIDISQNTKLKFLECTANQLTELDISKNLNLEELYCPSNNLTELDVTKHLDLSILECAYNKITALDLSQNAKLTKVICFRNKLSSINLKNGNNNILTTLSTKYNLELTCIEVDDVVVATNKPNWIKDVGSNYSESCGVLSNDDFETDFQIQLYPNPAVEIVQIKAPNTLKINSIEIYDTMGSLVLEEKTQFKHLNITNLSQGVFFVIIKANGRSFIKKIIKN